MDCDHIADDMICLLDDELSSLAAEAVHTHFMDCDRCSRFYQSLRSQLVSYRWSVDLPFDLDEASDCRPEDIPDYGALNRRLRNADVRSLGHLLYQILKSEFYSEYQDLEPQQEVLTETATERARAIDMVEELRDWHDADEVSGVDLVALAQRLEDQTPTKSRLELLIEGMDAVATAAPDLRFAARYLQAIAHVKACQQAQATSLFELVLLDGPPSLARISRICLATLPVLLANDPDTSIAALGRCLEGDAADALVHYNLARSMFLKLGRLDVEARRHIKAAQTLDAAMVTRQLKRPSEQLFRAAVDHPTER